MEVRNEMKKKGVGGSFTPYSRYKSSERNFSFALLMSLLSTERVYLFLCLQKD